MELHQNFQAEQPLLLRPQSLPDDLHGSGRLCYAYVSSQSSIMVTFQDFFFCLSVFIVLEFDLTMLQDSRINTVDYVLNFFISWFYAAG